MKLSIPAGTTSKRIAIFIADSSSTTGAGLTGLTNGSSGLVCYSWIDTDGNAGGTSQALQSATRGSWTTRGFIEKDATNMPGWYEFGVPDALLAAGVKWAVLHFKGATNMAPLPIEIEVTAISNQDAVRGGMTALPNANAEAAGGLYTRGTGAGQIRQDANGRIDANAKAWIDGTIPAVNVTGVPKVDLVDWLGSAPDALSSGKIPADLKLWLAAAPDALSSGKVAGDLKLWLAAAPAALSTNGYVQAMLLRWLTDNAGGTPNALISGRVDANAQVVGDKTGYTASTVSDKTGYSLSSAGIQAIWDALTSALTTAGSIGKRIVDFLTGDAYVRLGAPAGASVSADVAAIKADSGAIKTQTDKLAFTVANQVDANVLDWKSGVAPAMTGDAFARLGAPAGASVSADVASIKTDTGTTIPGRLPAALTAGGRIKASIEAIVDVVAGATALDRSARAIVIGTVGGGASTTSIPTSSLTPAASVADQFKGRIVIFDQNTATVTLRGQATDITASSAGGTLTVTALTTAPASGDTFTIT